MTENRYLIATWTAKPGRDREVRQNAFTVGWAAANNATRVNYSTSH